MTELPKPQVIEELDFETILTGRVADIKGRFESAGVDYDVGNLETDPVKIELEENSYRETLLRARANDVARANILPFAIDSDLDYLAAFYDVVRMPGETDDRLRLRVVLEIQGRSTGGTEPRYKAIAMRADLRIKDVAIYTVGRNPTINVAVFSVDNSGVADPALVAKVQAALDDPAKRMVNDVIAVQAAAQIIANVSADVWLLPEASADVVGQIEPALRDAWSRTMSLGRDLTTAWLTSAMMRPGVQRIELVLPAGTVVANFRQAIAIGAVSINYRGRDY